MEISYTRVGDYRLPDIRLSDPPDAQTEPITRYGAMRRSFLKTHRPILYSQLLLSERLFPHLREVQAAAQARLDSLLSDILVFNPPPDKAADGLAWAAHMTEIHRIAEKMTTSSLSCAIHGRGWCGTTSASGAVWSSIPGMTRSGCWHTPTPFGGTPCCNTAPMRIMTGGATASSWTSAANGITPAQIVKLLLAGYTQAEIAQRLGFANHSGVCKRIQRIGAAYLEYIGS